MKSKKWIQRNSQDIYVKKAKNEGYFSRSAFKLLEIEKKYKLILKSKSILELGSSPGGWSQIICEINKNVKVDSFDLLDMSFKHKNISFYKKNFMEFDFEKLNKKYDLILSDMAPNTLGHKSTDHLRLSSILFDIINILDQVLIKKGVFVAKIWKGSEERGIINILKKKKNLLSLGKWDSKKRHFCDLVLLCSRWLGGL